MITATTVRDYPNYYIDKYIYSADVSATGEELTAYEVYSKVIPDLIEAFDTLEEAIDYVENQQVWDAIVCRLPNTAHVELY